MAQSPEFEYETVWPLGRPGHSSVIVGGETTEPQAVRRGAAPFDPTGKRIAFIWDYCFRGDLMFEAIKERLRSEYDGVSFIDYETFGNVHGDDQRAVTAAIPDKLLKARADAAIVGVGA